MDHQQLGSVKYNGKHSKLCHGCKSGTNIMGATITFCSMGKNMPNAINCAKNSGLGSSWAQKVKLLLLFHQVCI